MATHFKHFNVVSQLLVGWEGLEADLASPLMVQILGHGVSPRLSSSIMNEGIECQAGEVPTRLSASTDEIWCPIILGIWFG